MILKSKAIVLRSMKFGEASLIIDMFTEQEGRISFITRIPKTAKGKIKKQYFKPLTLLELEVDYRPHTSLQHIKGGRVLYPYASIPLIPSNRLSCYSSLSSYFMLHEVNSRISSFTIMCVLVCNGWMVQRVVTPISILYL